MKKNYDYGNLSNNIHHFNSLNEFSTQAYKVHDSTILILEYTKIKDKIYCLMLSCKGMKVNYIGKASEIEFLSKHCFNQLKVFSIDFKELFQLSKILLLPIETNQHVFQKMIIIKDDNSIPIPFDVLLMGIPEPGYQNNQYLIDKYDISYAHSIKFVLTPFYVKPKIDIYSFVGFAPTSFENSNSNTDNLDGSQMEISNISKLFTEYHKNSTVFFGEDANAINFSQFAGKTSILHIATHSFETKLHQSGFLLSSQDTSLNMHLIDYYDILNLCINPRLVVLSSCTSNSGTLIQGEGIQNLGRAFSMTGSSNIISSLFRVHDDFSSLFMSDFYKRLLKTGSIDKSLSESKRFFLKSKQYSYPTFWSNFNLTEND
jgi:CHAT domain-containing protein